MLVILYCSLNKSIKSPTKQGKYNAIFINNPKLGYDFSIPGNDEENNLYKNDKVNKTINISNILVNILKNTFIVGFWTRTIIK